MQLAGVSHTFCGVPDLALGCLARLEWLVRHFGRGPVGVTPAHCAGHVSVAAGFESVRKGRHFGWVNNQNWTTTKETLELDWDELSRGGDGGAPLFSSCALYLIGDTSSNQM